MTSQEIEELVIELPEQSPYWASMFGAQNHQQLPSFFHRITKAVDDPAFGWHVPSTYAAAGLPLPNLPWPLAVLRAYRHLTDATIHDHTMVLVESLQLPENRVRQDLLRALLLCPDGTPERITESLQCEPELVGLFAELLWNVRHRRQEPLYCAQLLQGVRLVMQSGHDDEQTPLGLKWLTLAVQGEEMRIVLSAAGVLPPFADQCSTAKLTEEIADRVFAAALAGLARGQTNPRENQALGLVLRYLLPLYRQNSTTTDPLHGFQISPADLEPLLAELEERLKNKNEGTACAAQAIRPIGTENSRLS